MQAAGGTKWGKKKKKRPKGLKSLKVPNGAKISEG